MLFGMKYEHLLHHQSLMLTLKFQTFLSLFVGFPQGTLVKSQNFQGMWLSPLNICLITLILVCTIIILLMLRSSCGLSLGSDVYFLTQSLLQFNSMKNKEAERQEIKQVIKARTAKGKKGLEISNHQVKKQKLIINHCKVLYTTIIRIMGGTLGPKSPLFSQLWGFPFDNLAHLKHVKGVFTKSWRLDSLSSTRVNARFIQKH